MEAPPIDGAKGDLLWVEAAPQVAAAMEAPPIDGAKHGMQVPGRALAVAAMEAPADRRGEVR